MRNSRADNNVLKEELLDLQSLSMRDNLMKNPLLRNCANKLKMGRSVEKMKMGRRIANKPRPIVAKFNFFTDREEIRRRSRKLKGTPFGISEQFPQEIRDRRRELINGSEQIWLRTNFSWMVAFTTKTKTNRRSSRFYHGPYMVSRVSYGC